MSTIPNKSSTSSLIKGFKFFIIISLIICSVENLFETTITLTVLTMPFVTLLSIAFAINKETSSKAESGTAINIVSVFMITSVIAFSSFLFKA